MNLALTTKFMLAKSRHVCAYMRARFMNYNFLGLIYENIIVLQ